MLASFVSSQCILTEFDPIEVYTERSVMTLLIRRPNLFHRAMAVIEVLSIALMPGINDFAFAAQSLSRCDATDTSSQSSLRSTKLDLRGYDVQVRKIVKVIAEDPSARILSPFAETATLSSSGFSHLQSISTSSRKSVKSPTLPALAFIENQGQ